MFGLFKNSEPKPLPPSPKFRRGDKVRDIYEGPVMFVDDPREVRFAWIDTYSAPEVRVKCCRWINGELKVTRYEEDELKPAEESP